MLEQNTDRMLAVGIAIAVGALLLAGVKTAFPELLDSVIETIKTSITSGGNAGFSSLFHAFFI